MLSSANEEVKMRLKMRVVALLVDLSANESRRKAIVSAGEDPTSAINGMWIECHDRL